MSEYNDFKKCFKLVTLKNKHLVENTLSNIFTMRLIGNKTHGDLAEIAIVEFIKQFMDGFTSKHVGKEQFRSKDNEEDILIVNELNQKEFPVSLKAYGDGPLQLSTDRNQKMFPYLDKKGIEFNIKSEIDDIFHSNSFSKFGAMNVMPLIYDEKKQHCNILIFDHKKAILDTKRIIKINKGQKFDFKKGMIINGKGRKHPIFMFLNKDNEYICEIRYGGASSNALQRGLWTHTKRAIHYFDSITNGWIHYSYNHTLIKMFSLALNSTDQAHESANLILQKAIDKLKTK